jgi:palmitoyltransferase
MLDTLINSGADIYSKNLFGLNVLHIAAQGDQPISIYYFKRLGMDLSITDKRGSTPLHWACFQNSEIALLFLLGWVKQSKLSLQDVDGFTPLHLTIKSSE